MCFAVLSVIIPTYKRSTQLCSILDRILQLQPAPIEILVHIDAGDSGTYQILENKYAGKVSWFQSVTTQGPGGGRNLLVQRASSPFVVSLDDDSWPLDDDFFQKAVRLMEQNPKAGVIATSVTVAGSDAMPTSERIYRASRFENCGCVIRRDAFLQTRGFLPLRYAYGMEEADLSLQLLDRGWDILHAEGLRVFHDTGMAHHASPQVNAAQITNTALLAFLRYPVRFWLLGLLQVANRVAYCLKTRRYRGILKGIVQIPLTCLKYRNDRVPVTAKTLLTARRLRKPVTH